MKQKQNWKGYVSIEDTKLYVSDTGGQEQTIIYLNGSYANHGHWKKVVKALGPSYRHVLYDERARGKSKRSKDYSFQACLRDLDAIINARGIQNPILVGWSYGATLAVYWARLHPSVATGIVAVDAAVPYGIVGESARDRINKIFNKVKWILPFASVIGLAAKMSAKKHAEINIEINEISANLEPVLLDINIPVRYIFASGASRGVDAEEFKAVRESIQPILLKKTNLKIDAVAPSNHETILAKDYQIIARTIHKLAEELRNEAI